MRPTGLLPGAIAPDARGRIRLLSPKVFAALAISGCSGKSPAGSTADIARMLRVRSAGDETTQHPASRLPVDKEAPRGIGSTISKVGVASVRLAQ